MKDYDKDDPSSFISRVTVDSVMTTEFLNSIAEGLLCVLLSFFPIQHRALKNPVLCFLFVD